MFRYRPLTLALLAAMAHGSLQAETEGTHTLLIEQGHFWQNQEKPSVLRKCGISSCCSTPTSLMHFMASV